MHPLHLFLHLYNSILWVFKSKVKKTHMLWKHPTSLPFHSYMVSNILFFQTKKDGKIIVILRSLPPLVIDRGACCRKASFISWSVSVTSWLLLQHYDEISSEKRVLTWWPWPLTYDLVHQTWPIYPPTWPTYQNSRLYVCPSGSESETHRHTHRRCQNYYTPSLTRGVKI